MLAASSLRLYIRRRSPHIILLFSRRPRLRPTCISPRAAHAPGDDKRWKAHLAADKRLAAVPEPLSGHPPPISIPIPGRLVSSRPSWLLLTLAGRLRSSRTPRARAKAKSRKFRPYPSPNLKRPPMRRREDIGCTRGAGLAWPFWCVMIILH